MKLQIEKSVLTVEDVMEVLQVCRTTVYRLRKDDRLKAMPIGRSVRFAREEVERFVNEEAQQ